MALELDFTGLTPEQLHAFAVACVEHVLAQDTPELCRQGLQVKGQWTRGQAEYAPTLTAFRRAVASAVASEQALWRDSGIPTIALRATLAAMGEDALSSATLAAELARSLAGQRGYARSDAQSSRGRGDSADDALEREAQHQRNLLEALRGGAGAFQPR